MNETPIKGAESTFTGTINLPPPVQSILRISPDFRIHCRHPRPNAFRRFWCWLLLGWTWEKVAHE